MPIDEPPATLAFWNAVAEDWRIQVGDEGDRNRVFNSDPVLWAFAGEVNGRDVLDAGCGVGYLTKKLHDRGARAIGVDFSERMIELARERYIDVELRVDSCEELRTVGDASVDLIVSNYVLMDLPDLEGAVAAFHRVLRPGGAAALVFSHPCFPAGSSALQGETPAYCWTESYFERGKRVDPPWAHFRSEFIWFHRPLSDYWKSFRRAGFRVTDFEEPRLTADRFHLAEDEETRRRYASTPYSVAFRLEKP
jgi:ubiquinone/menaquinone biosynthesis C-methylase UbiE